MARYAKSILELVSTAGRHRTAEQIYLLLKEEYPHVVMATVYNNLNALNQQGLIRKISVAGFPDRYDVPVRHDHLVCRRCGRLSDIALTDLTAQLQAQAGVPIEGYDLQLFWLCPACRASD